MARYFAGTTLASFRRNATGITETTSNIDTSYVTKGISIPGVPNSMIKTAPFSASGGEIWSRFDLIYASSNTAWPNPSSPFVIGYSSSTPIWRIRGNSSAASVTLEVWNGTSWLTAISTTYSANDYSTYVVKYDTVNKRSELFRNGISIASIDSIGSGMITTMDSIEFYATNNSGHLTVVSQVMIADYDLRGSNYSNLPLTGNSTVNTGQASGGFADINETGRDDATVVTITTSGNKAGFTKTSYTVPANKSIGAFVVSAIARISGTITNGRIGVRSGTTEVSSSNLNFDGGFDTRQFIQTTDPATSTSFTESGLNSAEIFITAI